jgi:hypothetical protein
VILEEKITAGAQGRKADLLTKTIGTTFSKYLFSNDALRFRAFAVNHYSE